MKNKLKRSLILVLTSHLHAESHEMHKGNGCFMGFYNDLIVDSSVMAPLSETPDIQYSYHSYSIGWIIFY